MSDLSSSLPEPAHLSAAPMLVEAAPLPVSHDVVMPPFAVRLWCAFVFLICVGMLGVGLYLTPDPDGFGKHQGLFGMPPCGFYQATGLPCFTCGCTTAVSHFSHGHILTSLLTQPFGFTVALLAALLVPLTGFGIVTGKWRGPSMFTLSWYWRYWVFGGMALILCAWVYKIMLVKYGGG